MKSDDDFVASGKFGRTLCAYRHFLGLNRLELVEASGWSEHHIKKIENATSRPSPEVARDLAQALGTDLERLQRLYARLSATAPRGGAAASAAEGRAA